MGERIRGAKWVGDPERNREKGEPCLTRECYFGHTDIFALVLVHLFGDRDGQDAT